MRGLTASSGYARRLLWAACILLSTALCHAGPDRDEAATGSTAVIDCDDTEASVAVINGGPALTGLMCRSSNFEWVGGADGAATVRLIDSAEIAGRPIPLHWRFVGRESASGASRATFRFECDDAGSGLKLELHSDWEASHGPGPVEHRIIIYNRGREPVLLPVQDSLSLSLRASAGHALEQWWVEKGAGTPTGQGTHRVLLKDGAESSVRCWPSGRDQPRDAIPWVTLQDVEGRRGLYAGVEWTARVDFNFKIGQDRGAGKASLGSGEKPAQNGESFGRPIEVRIGLMREDKVPYFTRVLPGERFEVPPAFIGCYAGDVDDGANRLRRWVRDNVAPPARDDRYPLLVNNSWGSGMAVDDLLARRMIDESADLGLELFHIDAGWFRAVGDWRPDPRKFPRGISPVADYAHARGLKFGLWVGWTQGGDQVDSSGKGQILSVRDPAMKAWFCQPYEPAWKPGDFTGATVCLAEPKAVDWCLDRLRSIVREDKLDLLEHDQTMVTDDCQQADHPHTRSRSDIGYRAAQGYYRVYDMLRAENPNLLFENCVNGGHMIDYGALRRCHYISITDTYDPLSNRRAFYDASFALPPAMCECYIEQAAALANRGLPQFRFMLRSGMMGWCTIMTDTRKWTPAQHEAAQREFALYKSRLRPLIRAADLFHVSDRPNGVRWDGMEYFDPSTGRGALFAFRGTGDEPEHVFPLKGLDPAKIYAVSFEDGSNPPADVSGRELMSNGLRMKLPERESSDIVFIEQH